MISSTLLLYTEKTGKCELNGDKRGRRQGKERKTEGNGVKKKGRKKHVLRLSAGTLTG
jgi:hypothetical protein